MADVRIGLVGAGTWGKNYVRNLAAIGVLHAVCDANEKVLEQIKAAHPTVKTTTNLDDLCAMDDLSGVVVATHTPNHHPVAKKLLEAKKHCHVEKPLTDSPEKSLELCEIAEANNLTLMVGHILLYHPVVQHIQGMVERGELGDIYYINCIRTNLGTIRRNENVMWSMAPHDISVVQFILGQNPDEVSATGGAFVQTEAAICDVTNLTMHFPDGKLSNITSSWLDPEKVRLTKVVGSEKMVVFDDMDPRYKLSVHEKGVDWKQFNEQQSSSFLKVRSGDVHIPFVKPTEPLKAECLEFVECIKTGRTPLTSGRQGHANVCILSAADKSLASHGKPFPTGI